MFARLNRPFKGLILIGLGVFLLGRISSGTLLFYINQRFAWLTWLAALLFLLLGTAYYGERGKLHAHQRDGEACQHADTHGQVTPWWALLLVALPALLGWLVPPRPLGAQAMGNRELVVSGLTASADVSVLTRASEERDILDWLRAFDAQGVAAFDGQAASLLGFVYHPSDLPSEQFQISRFVVVCCVADAAPVGLPVLWPDAAAWRDDAWVQVQGRFGVGADGQPILLAETVTAVDSPQQPYLYP